MGRHRAPADVHDLKIAVQMAQAQVSATQFIADVCRRKGTVVWSNVAVENWRGRRVDVGFVHD